MFTKTKRRLLSGLFASALLIAAGTGAMESKKSDVILSDLAMANVEALAKNENPGSSWDCDPSDTIVCYWDSSKKDIMDYSSGYKYCILWMCRF